jgi:diguanylate cyclase (GGDEF)-like protein/PAS domain S-box-containing protein
VSDDPTSTPTTADAVAARLLADHPEAIVAAMESFSGLYCEMPANLPLKGQRVIRNGRLWDMADKSSRAAIFDAWRRVRQHGAASAVVTLAEGGPGTMHFIDVRKWFGVVLALVVPGEADSGLAEIGGDRPARSRFGRFWRDDLGRIVRMDEAAEELLGFTEDELQLEEAVARIDPDHHDLAFENWIETLSSPGKPRRWRCRHLRKDGTYLWVEITNRNLLEEDEGLVLSEMMDISDEMAATERLRDREELLDRLAESLPSGIAQIDRAGDVTYTNNRLHEILGTGPKPGFQAQFAAAAMDDQHRLATALDRVVSTGVNVALALHVDRHDQGLQRVCDVTLRALRDAAGDVSGAVITVEDVTESMVLRRELERRANIDPLTACLNRATTMAQLDRVVDQRIQPDLGTGVIFVDLDRFKPINDRHGHAAGDEVLAEAAERLRRAVRAEDIVGRLGGDEFLVICPALTRPDVALAVAGRVAQHVAGPFTLASGEIVDLEASIGAAWAVNQETTGDALVARADAAMYEAKRERSGRPVLAQLTPPETRGDVPANGG